MNRKTSHDSRATDNSKLCESKGHRVMGLQLERHYRLDGKVKLKARTATPTAQRKTGENQ
jgi:hypothetical protein